MKTDTKFCFVLFCVVFEETLCSESVAADKTARFCLEFMFFFICLRLCAGIPILKNRPGRVAQSVGHPTHKSGVLGSIPGLATYFRFSFRFFKKGSCQLLAKVCARSTG